MTKCTVLALLTLPVLASAQTTTVTFDDLPDNADENVGLPAKYMGLTWSTGWGWTDGLLYCFGPCGYINGTVSRPIVGYTALGKDVSVSAPTPFTFHSAYLSAAWNNGMHVAISGYLAGVQTNSLRLQIDSLSAQNVSFNWDVDTVLFHSEADGTSAGYNGAGGQIVFDNMVFTFPRPAPTCDRNGDGKMDVTDAQTVVNEAMGGAPAVDDMNGDGMVNIADVTIVVDAAMGEGCSATSGAFPALRSRSRRDRTTTAVVRQPIEDLGSLGGASTTAHGINNLGQVVGVSDTAQSAGGVCGDRPCPVVHAFLWEAGRMTDLSPADSRKGIAYAVNDAGRVVVYARGLTARIRALNNTGQSAGSFVSEGVHAFLEADGRVTDLRTLGGSTSQAYGVNDAGEVVGSASLAGDAVVHAFLYRGAGLIDLGTLGGTNSAATAINGAGQIVGWSQTAGDESRHAFLDRGGALTDLGTLGGADSQGDGINRAGVIVGWAMTASDDRHAFLWSSGRMVDLNSMVTVGPDIELVEATAINDVGQIVANGSNGRAYLITLTVEWH